MWQKNKHWKLVSCLVLVSSLVMLPGESFGASDVQTWWQDFTRASQLRYSGQYADGLVVANRALAESRSFDRLDPRFSESLRLVARLHLFLEAAAAEPYLLEEAKVLEQISLSFPDLDFDYLWLGAINEQRSSMEKAREYFLKALPITQQFIKNKQEGEAFAYAHLALIDFYEGKDQSAQTYFDKAASNIMLQKSSGPWIAEVGGIKTELERASQQSRPSNARLKSAYAAAVRQFQKSCLEQCARIHGKDSDVYLDVLHAIAQTYRQRPSPYDAMRYTDMGLTVLEKRFPYDYERFCRFRLNRALVLASIRDYEQSIVCFKRAMKDLEKVDGVGRQHALNDVLELGGYLRNLGCLDAARYCFDSIPDLMNYVKVHKADEELVVLDKLMAERYLGARQYLPAAKAYERLFAWRKQKNISQWDNFEITSNIAQCYFMAHDYVKAEPLLLSVLNTKFESYGYLAFDIYRRAADQLAVIYRASGRAGEADKLIAKHRSDAAFLYKTKKLQELSEKDRNAAAKYGLEFSATYFRQAETYEFEGNQIAAIKAYKDGIAITERLGHSVLSIQSTLNCARLEVAVKRYNDAERHLISVFSNCRYLQGEEFMRLFEAARRELRAVYALTGRQDRASLLDQATVTVKMVSNARTLEDQFQYKKAAQIWMDVLARDTRLFAEGTHCMLFDLDRIIRLSSEANDLVTVESYCKRLLVLKPPPFFEVRANATLASVYNRSSRFKEAEAIAEKYYPRALNMPAEQQSLYYNWAVASILSGNVEFGLKRLDSGFIFLNEPDMAFPEALRPLKARPQILEKIVAGQLNGYKSDRRAFSYPMASATSLLADAYALAKKQKLAKEKYKEAIAICAKVRVSRNWVFEAGLLRAYRDFLQANNEPEEAKRVENEAKNLLALYP